MAQAELGTYKGLLSTREPGNRGARSSRSGPGWDKVLFNSKDRDSSQGIIILGPGVEVKGPHQTNSQGCTLSILTKWIPWT